MRLVRGTYALSNYLKSINCPMSQATIYRLIKKGEIPFKRPTPGILVFNLDAIDNWLLEDSEPY